MRMNKHTHLSKRAGRIPRLRKIRKTDATRRVPTIAFCEMFLPSRFQSAHAVGSDDERHAHIREDGYP
jgi:hypothetical protein